MAFGITIGTERAQALQTSIESELEKRGYEADSLMAEFITIMLINNKTAAQITTELEDVLGSGDYDASFTDWLFAEAARISAPEVQAPPPVVEPAPKETTPQVAAGGSRQQSGPRSSGVASANQQAIPSSSSQTGHKRTASARSPSPGSTNLPNKSRRTDGPPTGPRAMNRDGGRSLLERMGGRQQRNFGRDEIQARIDAVTAQQSAQPQSDMMGINGYGNNGMGMMMGGGDMGQAMQGMGTVNPMALQEMMMNQMALMAQMAGSMNMMNTPQGPMLMGQNGYPMMNGMNNGGFDGNQNANHQHAAGNGRGGATAGRGRGRGGSSAVGRNGQQIETAAQTTSAPAIVAPTPKPAEDASKPAFTPPERPQSPTLCKFSLRCTNASCRYSHPSPVATPESGVVLSNDPCEAGKNCKDKDSIKAHVSPAVTNGAAQPVHHPAPAPVVHAPSTQISCRYGAGCLRINSGCTFAHPKPPPSTKSTHFNQQCRFGASCTRQACPFQHPQGRVLPNSFHRGLGTSTPPVTILGTDSPHKSVVFNKSNSTLAKKAVEAEKKMEKAEAAEVEATVTSASTVEAAA